MSEIPRPRLPAGPARSPSGPDSRPVRGSPAAPGWVSWLPASGCSRRCSRRSSPPRYRRPADGLPIGVASGAGLAVLETMGYSFVTLILSHGDLSAVGASLTDGPAEAARGRAGQARSSRANRRTRTRATESARTTAALTASSIMMRDSCSRPPTRDSSAPTVRMSLVAEMMPMTRNG